METSKPPPPVHPNIIHHKSLHTLAEEPTPLVSNPPSQPAPVRETVVKRSYAVKVSAKQGVIPLTGQNQDMPGPYKDPGHQPD